MQLGSILNWTILGLFGVGWGTVGTSKADDLQPSSELPLSALMGLDNPDGSLALFWAPASDLRSTYHVYRTSNDPGSSWIRWSDVSLRDPWFIDTELSSTPRVPRVRSEVVRTVEAGSVARLIAGTFYS